MWTNWKIPKILCAAALIASAGGCNYVTVAEGNAWGDQVVEWAAAISAAVCMMEEAVFDNPSTVGGVTDPHTHTHGVPTPANRYCPPGPPPDPIVPPPPPPEFGD